MNPEHTTGLEDLLDAALAGERPIIPESLQVEMDQALAGHVALREFLDVTNVVKDSHALDRCPPELSADYQVQRELGRGGMGVVYLVHQRSLNRQVALKVLRPGELSRGLILKRFRDEARHLARLRHPNIVSIHEVGDAGGEPYFTMDFIDGEPLSAIIARGPLSPTQALAILKQVANAVEYAHRQGIIHRDLKPSNVLVDDSGHVFVTDFGLARDVSQSAGLTQSGEVLGTPQYMAPEQARGQSSLIGEATDIHALGLLLFEMLSGRGAFTSSSPADVLVKLLNEDPPPLRSLDRRIPRDLETICQKMLQKSPQARYPSVGVLLEDIGHYEAGKPLIARRTSVIVRGLRWCRRHWKVAAAALLGATLSVAVVPTLLDKSFEELVTWGDEELASGHPELAAQVYSRALRRASPEERQRLTARIVQTCRVLDDPETAVGLALQVIDLVPEESFGSHDFLVAQALVARVRAKSPAGVIDIWDQEPVPELSLVKSRLELAVRGELNDEQRREAEGTLTAINLVLTRSKPWTRYTPEYLFKLPSGTVEELAAAANDPAKPLWDRGRAAMSLGRLHEQEGRRDDALVAYRMAYEHVRSVYPMYGGVKASGGPQPSRVDASDAEECELIRDLVDDLRRLAPKALAEPQGAIEFDVIGYRMPSTIGIELTLELCDPSIDNPNEGLPHNLPRLVPLRQDAPVRVQVLDGKYRLRYRGHHSRWEPSADRLSRLVQVGTSEWPAEIEIRGEVLRLPPVRLSLAKDIVLQSPESGATVKLSDMDLRWQPVPGATRYQVNLLYTVETPSPSTFYFHTVTTEQPRLRLSDLPEFDKTQIRRHLVVGRTGGWRVDAYDAQGRRVGQSLLENRFLVAESLPAP